MIALLQRVKRAGVTVGGEAAGAIEAGLLVFVADPVTFLLRAQPQGGD